MRTSIKRTIFIRRCLERGHCVANTLGSRGLPPVVRAQGANLGLGSGSGSMAPLWMAMSTRTSMPTLGSMTSASASPVGAACLSLGCGFVR